MVRSDGDGRLVDDDSRVYDLIYIYYVVVVVVVLFRGVMLDR